MEETSSSANGLKKDTEACPEITEFFFPKCTEGSAGGRRSLTNGLLYFVKLKINDKIDLLQN